MLQFSPKTFTEEQTKLAKKRGSTGQIGYLKYQRTNGELSGAARRHKALALALAGTKSRKTARTACTSILSVIELIDKEEYGFTSFKKTIFNLAKKMPPLEVFFTIHKRVQSLFVLRHGGSWVEDGLIDRVCLDTGLVTHHKGPNRSTNPFADFQNACVLAEEFIKKILSNFFIAQNPLTPPIASSLAENEYGLEAKSTKSDTFTSDTSLRKRPPLRLPTELYADIRSKLSKLLPRRDRLQVTGKLADCYERNDWDKFCFVLAEAKNGRSIFENTGKKGTVKRRKSNIFIDTVAGQLRFLRQYGVAHCNKYGHVYA